MTKQQLTARRKKELDALISTGLLGRNHDDNGYNIDIHTQDDTLGLSNVEALKKRHGSLLAFTHHYGGTGVVLYDHFIRINTLTGLLNTLLEYLRYPVLDEDSYSALYSERAYEAWQDYLWDDVLDHLADLYNVHDTDDFAGWLDENIEGGDFSAWARENVIIEEDGGGFYVYDKSPISSRVLSMLVSYFNSTGGELPLWAISP